MGFLNKYPYTDFHELNLDWIMEQIKELHKDWVDFKAVNSIINAGAWDITNQYQAWSIVSDDNKGYISIQPVPAGVSINNTDYWILIIDYMVEVEDLEERVADLEEDMNDPGGKVPVLQGDVSDLDDRVTALEATDLSKPYLLVLGDSWSADPNGWSNYVAAKCGYVLQNYARSGYTYVNVAGTQGVFINALNDAISAIDNADRVKDIIVYGGLNDIRLGADNGDLASACTTLINTCLANFPNARVNIVGINMMNDQSIIDLGPAATVYLETAARVHGATFVDSNDWLKFITGAYDGDNIHPSATGLEIIRSYMCAILGGGQVNPLVRLRVSGLNSVSVVQAVATFNGVLSLDFVLTLPAGWSDDSWTSVAQIVGTNVLPSSSCITTIHTGGGSMATDYIGTAFLQGNDIKVKTFSGSSGAGKTISFNMTMAY